jgi:tripartite-type tricarboxylate transporter receptor subunit TctC
MTALARVLAIALIFAAGSASAADYPTRPIRFMIPWPAGGVADAVARVVGEKLAERLGQPVVAENRPGASGNIGMSVAAATPPNGYMLVLTPTGNLTVNQTLFHNLSYDVEKDFTPLTILATVPNVVVISRSVPANNLKDLIAYAKANPGKLTFASPGQGTGAQLGGELLKTVAGIDMLHVAYTGIAPAVNDLLGDRVSLMFLGISSALPQIEAGGLRAIAVATPERVPSLPNVPTVAESGYPGFDVTSWYGVVVRNGTPPDIVAKLYSEIAAVLKLDDVKERFIKMGVYPGGMAPAAFAKLVSAETKKWGDIIVRAGIKAE